MSFVFDPVNPPLNTSQDHWTDWKWQMRNSLKSENDFASFFQLNAEEKKALRKSSSVFAMRTTPYYAVLCNKHPALRKIIIPSHHELKGFYQTDPLGENQHSPVPRIVHRYPDRVLFLTTDFCGIYCRYCTRKYFTAQGHSTIGKKEYAKALNYIKNNQGIREVILSGGDPLTLSDERLSKILQAIRAIPHIEIIRIGTRMLTVCPFRITSRLIDILKKNQPVFIMVHFNHPKELTQEAQKQLLKLCDQGISIYNQMVLLNGINNHPAIVQALSRRLLYLRVRPYYMFQCDPSQGTDHFRTSIENSKWVQKQLWGVFSGLALPRLSMDLPSGGGKVELIPDHFIQKEGDRNIHEGFDGIRSSYPNPKNCILPQEEEMQEYLKEWELLRQQPYGNSIKEKTIHALS